MADPTITQAYAGKEILQRNNALAVLVVEDPTTDFVYLIKDSRAEAERESSTPFDGWKLYTYQDARTTFDTSMVDIDA